MFDGISTLLNGVRTFALGVVDKHNIADNSHPDIRNIIASLDTEPEVFIVMATYDFQTNKITALDKTAAEVAAAHNAGKVCFVRGVYSVTDDLGGGQIAFELPLTVFMEEHAGEEYVIGVSFSGIVGNAECYVLMQDLNGEEDFAFRQQSLVTVGSASAVPSSGTTGQVLTKAATGSKWTDAPDVEGLIDTHNSASDAHQDIRDMVTDAAASAEEEIVALMDTHNTSSGAHQDIRDLISSLGTGISGTSSGSGYYYPYGSIYMSSESTSPAELFGGEWEPLEDRFLLGAGSTYTAGEIDGEATHELTVDEMPSHNHSGSSGSSGAHYHSLPGSVLAYADGDGDIAWVQSGDYAYALSSTSSAGSHTHTITIGSTGGSAAHNNMPPYLVVYMWRCVSPEGVGGTATAALPSALGVEF